MILIILILSLTSANITYPELLPGFKNYSDLPGLGIVQTFQKSIFLPAENGFYQLRQYSSDKLALYKHDWKELGSVGNCREFSAGRNCRNIVQSFFRSGPNSFITCNSEFLHPRGVALCPVCPVRF